VDLSLSLSLTLHLSFLTHPKPQMMSHPWPPLSPAQLQQPSGVGDALRLSAATLLPLSLFFFFFFLYLFLTLSSQSSSHSLPRLSPHHWWSARPLPPVTAGATPPLFPSLTCSLSLSLICIFDLESNNLNPLLL